jgi:hypothetical protein
MTFITMTTSDFSKLVGKVGKSASEYNKLVQSALAQCVFQLSAYGNTIYADRLFTAIRTADKKRVNAYLSEHGKVYAITDKQRKQAQDKGKPIDPNRIYAKIAKTAPDTSTPEAKLEAENQAATLVDTLPDWVEWSRSKATSEQTEKVIKFGQTFGRLLESLDAGKIQDNEIQQVESFKSYAGLIQSGITLSELRQQIIDDYAASLTKAPQNQATQKVA